MAVKGSSYLLYPNTAGDPGNLVYGFNLVHISMKLTKYGGRTASQELQLIVTYPVPRLILS